MVILKNSTRESAKIGQAIDTQFQTGGDAMAGSRHWNDNGGS